MILKNNIISYIKLLIIAFSIAFIFGTCKESRKNTSAKIEILNPLIDLGRINQYDPVEVTFKIVNKGKTPFVIKNVKADCKCTSINWEKEPIDFQDSTFIKVKYDSSILGHFQQKVTVFSNAEGPPVLLLFRGKTGL